MATMVYRAHVLSTPGIMALTIEITSANSVDHTEGMNMAPFRVSSERPKTLRLDH